MEVKVLVCSHAMEQISTWKGSHELQTLRNNLVKLRQSYLQAITETNGNDHSDKKDLF